MALRRRLSDKDKERRLVRRSSSKRKDKENGGGTDKTGQVARNLLLPEYCIFNWSRCRGEFRENFCRVTLEIITTGNGYFFQLLFIPNRYRYRKSYVLFLRKRSLRCINFCTFCRVSSSYAHFQATSVRGLKANICERLYTAFRFSQLSEEKAALRIRNAGHAAKILPWVPVPLHFLMVE